MFMSLTICLQVQHPPRLGSYSSLRQDDLTASDPDPHHQGSLSVQCPYDALRAVHRPRPRTGKPHNLYYWSLEIDFLKSLKSTPYCFQYSNLHAIYNLHLHHSFSLFFHFSTNLKPQTVAGPSETSFAPFLRVRCEQTCTNTMPCFPIEVHSNDSRIDAACMPFVRSASICGKSSASGCSPNIRNKQEFAVFP